ncbi:MAG TPA: hypothetical protein PK335_12870 [Draconibacterium sp.]|nr:hypothetical protein [Draconibacterium sp.]
MKKLRISLLLFLVVLATSNTKAMGTVKVNTVPGQEDKLMVDVLEAPATTFQVEVKDNNGEIIYYDAEETKSLDDRKIFNLSELNDGKYTFEVKMGHESDMKDLVIKNGDVQVVNQEDQISPYFKLDGKYLEFTFPNLNDKNVRVLLYSNNLQHWVFQERINPEFEVQQALNLSELKPGSYTAVLISGDGRYSYNFDLS